MGIDPREWGSRCDLIGSHIAYALEMRQYNRAEAILKRAAKELEEERQIFETEFTAIPLSEIGLPMRFVNLLNDAFDVVTVADALNLNYGHLLQQKHIGPMQVCELFQRLAMFSLRKAIAAGVVEPPPQESPQKGRGAKNT